MGKTIIEFNLSEIDRAIAELQKFKSDFLHKVDLLCQALVELGVSEAKAQIKSLGAVYSGELQNSITGIYNSNTHTGYIIADCVYAVYVEYGTGVVGEGSPHPELPEWLVYDRNEHGESGWVYYNEDDSKFHWTTGMESRPFMYNTSEKLKKEYERIAKEVFSG